ASRSPARTFRVRLAAAQKHSKSRGSLSEIGQGMSANLDAMSSYHGDAARRLNILQVNTFDVGGGAEQVAMNLLRSYRARGHGSWLALGAPVSRHTRCLSTL